MLKDEVPRTAVVLYFFADLESESTRRDLSSLARRRDELGAVQARVLAISPAKMPQLRALQAELALPFPLLRDDRDFSQAYGVGSNEEGTLPAPALVVVNRQQRILWLANPVTSVEEVIPQVLVALKDLPGPTSNYPRKIINRLVDRWLN
jgi:peroxiredoxin